MFTVCYDCDGILPVGPSLHMPLQILPFHVWGQFVNHLVCALCSVYECIKTLLESCCGDTLKSC